MQDYIPHFKHRTYLSIRSNMNCTFHICEKSTAMAIPWIRDRIPATPETEIDDAGMGSRVVDDRTHHTRWLLEGSENGEDFFTLSDKSEAETNLPHDFIVLENGEGRRLQYIKLTVLETPFNQNAAISGLRVFGKGNGEKPSDVSFDATRTGELSMRVTMHADGAFAAGFYYLF